MLGAIAGLAGSAISGLMGMSSAKRQMKFQEKMSSTSHVREVADLKAAGLNPILSATGGGGASSPSGAGFSGVNPAESISSAMDIKLKKTEIKKREEEINNLFSTRLNTRAQTRLLEANRVLTSAQAPGALREAEIDKSDYGRIVRMIMRINPLGNSAFKLMKGR